ncbi:tyrosine-type recombinase/integrase [Candidatus Latescibacterota bacterium]
MGKTVHQKKKKQESAPSKNPNHPHKGSTIKVEPIRRKKDIDTIKKLLIDNPRNYCLFVLGINTNLRASDLIRITAGKVRGLKPLDTFEIKEKKTGKSRRINLNKTCIEAIQTLLASRPYTDEEHLFLSHRSGKALKVMAINNLVKKWCRDINLKGNYGSHSLRKTWGFHQRVTFNVGIPELMVCFNHSTQKQTLDYLCVQPDEIRDVYANEL